MALIKHNKAQEEGQYELTVAVDAETFNKAVDKVYRQENKKINIQGFRKGKTPRAVIERMYGENFFYEDAINDLLPAEFENALNEANIEIIGRPDIDVTEIGKEKGVTVLFKVKLRPELTVKKYKGIAATRTVHTVEDADVDKKLQDMQERGSRMVSVDDRAAQDGDTATIDFEGFVDGIAFEGGKGEKYDLKLGAGQFIPGFEEQVAGHKAGEAFDIEVTFPEDYNAEELAGKQATFKIMLHEIRYKEMPELDDELAKDMSEFDTLVELKADIRETLEKENDEAADAQLENDLVDAVAQTLEGDIPSEMIEERMDEMARDFGYRLQGQGLDLQSYLKYTNTDAAAFRESFKDGAEKFVRTRLALEAVARAEGIEVLDADVEAETAKLAEQYKMDAEKVKEILPRKELVADIKVNKAIEIIKAHAKVKEEKAKKETPKQDK